MSKDTVLDLVRAGWGKSLIRLTSSLPQHHQAFGRNLETLAEQVISALPLFADTLDARAYIRQQLSADPVKSMVFPIASNQHSSVNGPRPLVLSGAWIHPLADKDALKQIFEEFQVQLPSVDRISFSGRYSTCSVVSYLSFCSYTASDIYYSSCLGRIRAGALCWILKVSRMVTTMSMLGRRTLPPQKIEACFDTWYNNVI